MSTTTVLLLFITVGYSFQQDSLATGSCDPDVQSRNENCLSSTGFWTVDRKDLTTEDFCRYGLIFTQCIDSSCMSQSVLSAAQRVVPALNRIICPNCYDQPNVVTNVKQTCTVWGTAHVVPFNRQSETCSVTANSTLVIFENIHFTLTAECDYELNARRITGIRFDYHYCVSFSRTWRRKDGWKAETIATQGWFPHTIHITQNTTQALIELQALNTEIIISAPPGSDLLAVSISTGIKFGTNEVPLGGVCMSNYCTSDELLYSAAQTNTCTTYPPEFQKVCANETTDQFNSVIYDAVMIDVYLTNQANSSTLGLVEFQKIGLPIVMTLCSSAMMIATYIGALVWRRKEMKCKAATMEFAPTTGCFNYGPICCCFNNTSKTDSATTHKNLETAPIRAIWCWMVFCLNPHVIGILFPFTGMTIVSAFCGMWIVSWVGRNHQCVHFGASKFTLKSSHIMIVLLGLALPQQLGIGIIGIFAVEYYLIEVQFWWGIAVLSMLLFGGTFMFFLCLDMSFAAKILNTAEVAQQELPMAVIEVDQAELPQQLPPVQVQPLHMIQPSMPVEQIQQAHPVMAEPQQGPIALPLQDHTIQPHPQSYKIEAQPIFYGNPSDAPPPPNGSGAFSAPLPADVYQNPVKYLVAPDPYMFLVSSVVPKNSSEMSKKIAKRTIKIAGIEVDEACESSICAMIQELLQTQDIANALHGEDSRAASLRNDLATSLAEELKLYRNDSAEDLAYGLKEAILLWKDKHHL